MSMARRIAPPIFFACAKENGPCTVQKKPLSRRRLPPLREYADDLESLPTQMQASLFRVRRPLFRAEVRTRIWRYRR